MRIDTEVAVIGGGPAGAAIAQRLSSLGHRVVLIERDVYPRRRIGESLPPGILPLLDMLGVRERIENAGFLRPTTASIAWSTEAPLVREHRGTPGFQVDRGQFDALLLSAAQQAGVTLLQPATVTSIVHVDEFTWSLTVKQKGACVQLCSRFLVDASGKGALWRPAQQRLSAPTLALYAYWQNTALTGTESRVEAGSDVWYWGAPLPDGSHNIAVFMDADNADLALRKQIAPLYHALLQASTLLRTCLDGKPITKVKACNAGAYTDNNSVGVDFIKVGDACFSIDPLSSQGVQAALMSALQGSVVANTLITQPTKFELAQQFFRARQQESVARHSRWAAMAYADQNRHSRTAFWEKRSHYLQEHDDDSVVTPPALVATAISTLAEGTRFRLCPQARLAETPTLKRDQIVSLPALTHPSLPRPVAFVANMQLCPLLALISTGDTLLSIRQKVNRCVSPIHGETLVNWLLNKRILIPLQVAATDIGMTDTGL